MYVYVNRKKKNLGKEQNCVKEGKEAIFEAEKALSFQETQLKFKATISQY